MFRVRFRSVELHGESVMTIAELADRYATGVGHVTSRQDIQMHLSS